jgi:hypothetical protein
MIPSNDEDLAPNCELVGRCLIKGDNRRARWDGSSVAVVKSAKDDVRFDASDSLNFWRVTGASLFKDRCVLTLL